MGLYEQLAQNFPEEETVFGLCLLVPPQAFKPEWNEQLAREGVKVFQNSYNGRLFFFLKKAESQSQGFEPQAPPRAKPLKRYSWTEEEVEALRRLRAEGLTVYQIAERLGKSKQSIMGKLKALKMRETASKPTPKPSNHDDGLFNELMEGARLLYSHGLKKACSLLLREASRILEQS